MEDSYKFHTKEVAYEIVETKAGKDYYITGYISIPKVDLYNDLITPEGLKSMFNQLNSKTIKLDYEHEAWRDDASILPVGKIIESVIDDRGLWVKCKLNKASPKFKALWDSIRDGFVDAFSIAFTPIKTSMKTIGDTAVRLIDDLNLLNVALTGNPVCPGARMTGYDMKAVMMKSISDFTKLEEKSNMTEEIKENVIPEVADAIVAEVKEVVAEEQSSDSVVEEKMADKKPKTPEEEDEEDKKKKAETKSLEIAELKSELDKVKADLKALQEAPVFKSQVADEKAQEEVAIKSAPIPQVGLGLIR